MKKICLFFFSGTGMTKYIVDSLKREFEIHGCSIDCFEIESRRKLPDLSGCDTLGIAYPVHSFNAPQIIIDFVKRLHKSNGMDTFILHTAGENHFINYAASDLLIRKLTNKGYRVFYNRLIEMPSNFAIKHTDEEVRQIMNKADKNIPRIAQDIIKLRQFFMKWSLLSKIASAIGLVEWCGAHIIGKFFYVNRTCNHCVKCVKNCPARNIIKTKLSIQFKWHCILCMRCIYSCPKRAIDVHKPFKFIRFDEWYNLKQ